LNILRKRPDGFHELETVMHPVALHDELTFEQTGSQIQLTCSNSTLPTGPENLVYRATDAFLNKSGLTVGVKIHLEKRIPLAAGLGGGSGNAAITLLGLNQLFGQPLTLEQLVPLASALGSDVPYFLQNQPALCTGRGEIIQSLKPFSIMKGLAILLIHPGFGIATAWAYKELAQHPKALNGIPGRAQKLIVQMEQGNRDAAFGEFYNSLEAPALNKYPILAIYQEYLRQHGALGTLMSGSGSTTFAIVENVTTGQVLAEKFKEKFGQSCWTAVVPA
jgi:4-diphosphocytidyl-2-C-methyl-D-erythritol kinase